MTQKKTLVDIIYKWFIVCRNDEAKHENNDKDPLHTLQLRSFTVTKSSCSKIAPVLSLHIDSKTNLWFLKEHENQCDFSDK